MVNPKNLINFIKNTKKSDIKHKNIYQGINVMKKIIIVAIAMLLVGCASFEPKSGMTFEQFRSMTALSFNGSVISLGKLTGTNIDVYETFDQNNKRVARKQTTPPEGWKYYYFSNGRLVDQKDIQSMLDQRAVQQRKVEQDKAEALAKQQAEMQAKAAQAQKDAQAKAAQAQKDEAVRKEQQQNQQKLNQF